MALLESPVLGEEGFTLKDIVDVFCNDDNGVVVCEKWRDIARELCINSLQIEEWRKDEQLDKLSVKDVLHKILESWKSKKGKDATLKDLLTHLEKVNLKNVTDDLEKLFSTERRSQIAGELLKAMLPDKPNYYIPRTLLTRSVINVKVFSSTHRDVFVLDGIDRIGLSQLAKDELTDTSSHQVRKDELSVRFILLTRFGDWALLCEKVTSSIHLLIHREGRFHWICTKGDISELQKASEEKNQNKPSEEEFIEQLETGLQFQRNQPIVISDSPGMGKSLLLASIGRQLKQRCPHRVIAFIVISEFVDKISEMLPQSNNKEQALAEAILHMLSENISTREHIVHKIKTPSENSCTQVELMFDGFDEVSTENCDLALECLEILTAKLNSTVRVWVTTRPQHLQELENRFSVLAYNIQPFHEKHQMDFLTSYWNSQQNNLNIVKLERFSNNCVSTLKKKLNQKNDDIAGIPLQCMMIAEVYMQDALLFCDSKNGNLENRSEAVPSIDIHSIADLYEKTIEHKIDKFIKTYGVEEKQIDCIWFWHMYLALQLIFPLHVHKFKDTLQVVSRLREEDLENSGILECSGRTTRGPARFVHKTFAEYFCARFYVSHVIEPNATNFQNFNRTLPNLLFQDVLESSVQKHHSWATTYHQCSFKHPVLCHFINALLDSTTHSPVKQSVSEESTEYIKNVIYACIHSDFGNILKFLRGLKYPEDFINSIFNSESEILIDATRVASLDLLKFLMENFKHKALTKISGNQYPSMSTALHAAVRRGNYSIFEYVFKQHQFQYVVEEDDIFMDLVHCVVFDTTRCHLDEIQDRIHILTDLNNLKKEMIDHRDENKRTPLLETEVHIDLLKKLIDCGADLLRVNHLKDSILHHATYYMSTTDYYDLLQSIPIPTLISLLQLRNKSDEISFHLIVKRGFATRDILNLITSSGFDINTCGKWGRTGLFYALEMENEGMTISTVNLLLENGADHTRVDRYGDSIVHYSALKGRIDCLKVFLEEHDMDVNQINEDGNTPIFLALRNFHSAFETVQYLIEQGADCTILNSNQDNLLYHSAKYQQTECLELFLNRGGQNINQANNDGNTPLMCTLRWNNLKIVEATKLLLDKGADHRMVNKNGNNVLHRSAKIGSAECFSHFCTLPSLDVNARNCNQDTPLHIVFQHIDKYARRCDDYTSFLNIIDKLVSLGADVNAKNKLGHTPLDIYQRERLNSVYKEELMKEDVTIRELLEGEGQGNRPEKDNVEWFTD